MLLSVVVGVAEPVCARANEGALSSRPVLQKRIRSGVTEQVVTAGGGHHDAAGVGVQMIGVQIVKTRTVLELNISSAVRLHQEWPHFAAKMLLLMLLLLLLMMVMQQQALLFLLQILLVRLVSRRRYDWRVMNKERNIFFAHGLEVVAVVVVRGSVHLTGVDLPIDVTVRTDRPIHDVSVHGRQHWIDVDH